MCHKQAWTQVCTKDSWFSNIWNIKIFTSYENRQHGSMSHQHNVWTYHNRIWTWIIYKNVQLLESATVLFYKCIMPNSSVYQKRTLFGLKLGSSVCNILQQCKQLMFWLLAFKPINKLETHLKHIIYYFSSQIS